MNRRSDSLIFKCNAQLGDNWTFCAFASGDKYIATLTSVLYDTVFTFQDSIKIISLQRQDSSGVSIPDSLNGFEFRLSKQFGLLTSLNIKHFPQRYWIYTLKGIESVAGEQRISLRTIFDFDIGDVFHYSSYTRVSLSVDRWIKEKRKILSKTINSGNIVYTIEDSVYTLTVDPWTSTSSLTGSVISESYSISLYSNESLCSKLPHIAFLFTSYNYMTSWHRGVANRRGIYTTPCMETTIPSIPHYVLMSIGGCNGDPCLFPGGINLFLEGLGLFNHFSSHDSSTSVYSCIKNLVYYEKGAELYGTPIAFPVITGISSSTCIGNQTTIFPNPTSETATIESGENISNVEVYDCLLNQVFVKTNSSTNKIILNCSELANGFYIIKIIANGKNVLLKMVVSH